jgi:hypothetical protein
MLTGKKIIDQMNYNPTSRGNKLFFFKNPQFFSLRNHIPKYLTIDFFFTINSSLSFTYKKMNTLTYIPLLVRVLLYNINAITTIITTAGTMIAMMIVLELFLLWPSQLVQESTLSR